jgi:uncharacterized protein DUF4271
MNAKYEKPMRIKICHTDSRCPKEKVDKKIWRIIILVIYFGFVVAGRTNAQDSVGIPNDSLPKKESSAIVRDSSSFHIKKKPAAVKKNDSLTKKIDTSNLLLADTTIQPIQIGINLDLVNRWKEILADNAYYLFMGKGIIPGAQVHESQSRTTLFYVMVGLLLVFALIRLWFSKYLANLLTLFFRVSMRQPQIREQVLQSPLPSLLLNGLFVVSAGLFASFLLRTYGFGNRTDFWILFLNCAGLLVIIYLVKFLLLKLAGWIFAIQPATDTYLFIVFLTNKMLGLFLLPFVVMLSFSGALAKEILITIGLVMILIFFIYRFIVSFEPVRKEIKVSAFHFFLYLCAFEILPLFLIYKVLLSYLEKAF